MCAYRKKSGYQKLARVSRPPRRSRALSEKPKVKESDLQKAILQYLLYRGVYCWANKTQGTYDPIRKHFRTFHGLKGVSDILGVLPTGRFLAIEVKTPIGKLTDDQERFIDRINDTGGFAFVARSIQDVEKIFLIPEVKDSRELCPA